MRPTPDDINPVPGWVLDRASRQRKDAGEADPSRLTGMRLSKYTLKAIDDGLPEPKDGQTHRESALGVCRNLREAGVPRQLADFLMHRVLLADGASLDPSRPWSETHVRKIVSEIYKGPAPDQGAFLDGATHRLKALTLKDAAAVAAEEIDWVVTDLLAAGEKAVIAGPPKSLKTWLALHLARSVALAEPFLEEAVWQVAEPQPVLFVQEEGAPQQWGRRLMAGFADHLDAPFTYTHRGGFSLTQEDNVRWVVEQAQKTSARLIVLDPLQRITPGIKENDATETGPAWDAIHHIATETGAAVVVLHHARKGSEKPSMDAIRGSSRLAGEVDLIVVMDKVERGTLEVYLEGRDLVRPDDEGGNLEVAYDPDNPLLMRRTGFRTVVMGARGSVKNAVIEVLGDATSPLEIKDVVAGVNAILDRHHKRQSIDRVLQPLAKEGRVRKITSGKGKAHRWELVDVGGAT